MKILIESIPHDQHRYSTAGDWIVEKPDTLIVRVSQMKDSRHMFLVALHEMIEATLCAQRGIKQSEVDAFDIEAAEHGRSLASGLAVTGEPGDDPSAPYHREHVFAECIERLMAAELGVDWAQYDAEVEAL